MTKQTKFNSLEEKHLKALKNGEIKIVPKYKKHQQIEQYTKDTRYSWKDYIIALGLIGIIGTSTVLLMWNIWRIFVR